MLKARMAVLVSGGGTNLQALIDAQKADKIRSAVIALVISGTPNAYALVRARENNIPALLISKKDCASQEEFEDKLQAALLENDIDFIVMAGFLSILSGDFVKKWPRRIINIHPSLIPSFCGKNYYGLRVHEAALEKGVKVTGATVHFVNEIPDGGEIILQKAVRVLRGDTPETLQRRVMEQAEWQILPKAAELAAKDIINTGKPR
ncbi:MAG: phosphoribosylglycinamide formyltransferase [Oscillospiraceae bacterium]|jgi:phosphoribosylglycinamide formyltransferase-1|nr:phosphoribosylglycinamide formyltransferase [Oscillospiraceae bacterium]